jgi:TolB-like protein
MQLRTIHKLFFCVIVAVNYTVAVYGGNKKKLALIDFHNGNGIERSYCEQLTALIFVDLSEIEEISLVERKRLNQVIKEQRLTASFLTSKRGSLKLGALVGADYILTGRMYLLDNQIYINGKIIDCRSQRIKGISCSYSKKTSSDVIFTSFANKIKKYFKDRFVVAKK